jgi:hypothetical protein
MKRAMQMLTGSLLISLAPIASAQRDDEHAAALRTASGFVDLAGSDDNILALAYALREGVGARLTFPTDPESSAVPDTVLIDPPTGKMEWNDVKMALMLARDALQRYGIARPTGEQLYAVMIGGEAPAANGSILAFRGVLQMRADGMNWGAIAAERYRRPEITSRVHAQSGDLRGLREAVTESR